MSEPQHPPVPPQHPASPAAGPQHTVPQYPAAPPHPGAPAPQPSAPSYPAAGQQQTGEHLGRTALILAVVFFAFGLLKALALPFAYFQSTFTPFSAGMLLGLGDAVVFLGSAAALTLGLIAVRRPSQQLVGGLAIGIAAAQLAGILATWLSNAFFRFL